MDTYAQLQRARLRPDRRLPERPDGTPAPTGYFPDRSWPQQGQVTDSPVYDELYGPARYESLDGAESVDQHPYLQISATWTPPADVPRPSGRDDPLTDGPAAPTLRLLGLFYQRAQGSDQTHYLDAPGRRFPSNGAQDGASWAYYQDSRLAMLPYNPADDAGGEMPDTLQALPPSPAHGWAAQPAVNSRQAELDKMRVLKGQRPPHQERLANSTYAGQSYSARTAHVGARQAARGGSTPSWRTRG